MTTSTITRQVPRYTREELDQRFGASLAATLNSAQVRGRDRFATPSVLTGAARVEDIYASDVSISAAKQKL
ncbi:hypothetical protein DVA67_020365 [Solirubrobacter sp. CPCC 204708]|uniref:Uncharacterized protein n=1 Tax=Solirubrobacter deserti TaxID=2282478 RepID=A0ABT4RTP5_9ACTN|nr:hypothetical protein [Solirubrobacter deserti]MBE2318347.1 hypothetical protein [Solirubrobacter deserti]MDA0141945.1 hypothetical protein [Solirubrobacter deserti]